MSAASRRDAAAFRDARVLKTSAACPSIAAVRAPGPAGVLVRTSTTWRRCAKVSALSVPVSSNWSVICWSRSTGGVMTPSSNSMSVSSSTGPSPAKARPLLPS